MDGPSNFRKWLRYFEANLTLPYRRKPRKLIGSCTDLVLGVYYFIRYKKIFIIVTVVFGLLLLIGPDILRIFYPNTTSIINPTQKCLKERTDVFLMSAQNYDSYVGFPYSFSNFIPFIGNGYVGLSLFSDSPIYIKKKRTLSLPLPFHPVVTIGSESKEATETFAITYKSGIVTRIQCFQDNIDVTSHYYAHRKYPNILVQNIKILNPGDNSAILDVNQMGLAGWKNSNINYRSFQHGDGMKEYLCIKGSILYGNNSMKVGVVIYSLRLPQSIEVKPRSSFKIEVLTSVQYSDPVPLVTEGLLADLDKLAVQALSSCMQSSVPKLREEHVALWKTIWFTGFSISQSYAHEALNGDKINATLYYVLSQVIDNVVTEDQGLSLEGAPFGEIVDQCYGGHQTLQAPNLWSSLDSVYDINHVTDIWLLTLEKQGCHNLIKLGPKGVMTAMILSFGSLKFSQHHLEFNMHPKDLHRDLNFRNIQYGKSTYLNISVIVGEDNKANLFANLDKSEKPYYACDGGCLDSPVRLGADVSQFPVKLTEPVTSILYITTNLEHIQELKHTIHVQEIAEAPPHEHHVIALHRHGHFLGGLPALFWVSIAFLVIVFHLFLFKLVFNEYCDSPDKFRTR